MATRNAVETDMPDLIRMVHQLHSESVYNRIQLNKSKIEKVVFELVSQCSNDKTVVFVDTHQEVLRGFLFGYIDTYFFSDERFAQDLMFFVKSDARGSSTAYRLWSEFKKWAALRQVQEINMSVSTNIDIIKTDTFYKRLGLKYVGGCYKLRL